MTKTQPENDMKAVYSLMPPLTPPNPAKDPEHDTEAAHTLLAASYAMNKPRKQLKDGA